MSMPQKSLALGATPGKLVLIGVLGVVLIGVLVFQFKSSPAAEQTGRHARNDRRPTEEPAAEIASKDVPDPSGGPAEEKRPHQWPSSKLSDVLEYDPFATPSEFYAARDAANATRRHRELEAGSSARREELARRRAEQDQFLDQLQKEGVQAVVGSAGHGHAALVGSRTIRPGDVLGGFRVVAIEADGVVLERLPAE